MCSSDLSEKDYSFYIYDRWGELIFETHNLFEPWPGTYKSKIAQVDVYVWKAIFKDVNGKSHSKVGHVSLIK